MKKSINRMNILLLTSAFFLSNLVNAGQKLEERLNTTPDGLVDIDVMNGLVTIKTWDNSEVKVSGELSDVAEGYQFEKDGDRILFKVDMPKRNWGDWDDDDSKLTFWVPVKSQVKFEGVNSDVVIDDVEGGSKVNTVNGNITATKLSNRVSLETVNGEITSTRLNGKLRLSTINGPIKDTLSAGQLKLDTINGKIQTDSNAQELKLSNVNGDIKLKLPQVNEFDISTINGDVELELTLNKNSNVSISSISGNIELSVKGELSAHFNIETHAGGDIENELTSDKAKESKYGPERSLRFKVGNGEAKVNINSISGDISLER